MQHPLKITCKGIWRLKIYCNKTPNPEAKKRKNLEIYIITGNFKFSESYAMAIKKNERAPKILPLVSFE